MLLSVHPDLPLFLSGLYAVVSAVAFCVYAVDKAAAVHGRRRVPEAVLHLLALSGGWPGALAARGVLRHKTRKQPFRALFWGTVAVNLFISASSVRSLVTNPPSPLSLHNQNNIKIIFEL